VLVPTAGVNNEWKQRGEGNVSYAGTNGGRGTARRRQYRGKQLPNDVPSITERLLYLGDNGRH